VHVHRHGQADSRAPGPERSRQDHGDALPARTRALGALAARAEDAQVAAAPLTGFLLLAYFGAFSAMAKPSGWWITVASLFPPTAPIYMPLRAALTDVPAWQVAVAVLLMVLAILGLVRIGGRLYRGAVLHTAGRLRIRQAWRGAV
jgi:ABC-2 type transport system permease protein